MPETVITAALLRPPAGLCLAAGCVQMCAGRTSLFRKRCLQIVFQCAAFGIGRAFCLKEIGLNQVGIAVLADPAHIFRFIEIAFINRLQMQIAAAQVAQILYIVCLLYTSRCV